jgi:hypothetical protein
MLTPLNAPQEQSSELVTFLSSRVRHHSGGRFSMR